MHGEHRASLLLLCPQENRRTPFNDHNSHQLLKFQLIWKFFNSPTGNTHSYKTPKLRPPFFECPHHRGISSLTHINYQMSTIYTVQTKGRQFGNQTNFNWNKGRWSLISARLSVEWGTVVLRWQSVSSVLEMLNSSGWRNIHQPLSSAVIYILPFEG